MDTNKRNVTKRAKALCTFALLGGLFALCLVDVMAEDSPSPLIIFDGDKEFSSSTVEFGTIYRGPVKFTHGRHMNEYGIACSQCHHDDSGEPMEDLKIGDEVDSCADCHYEETLLRGKGLEEKSSEEALEHYPNAMHGLCINCHKDTANKTHVLSAPEACRGCHARVPEK